MMTQTTTTAAASPLMEIALRIREMRRITGFTEKQMAEKTEVTEEQYRSFETGTVDLPFTFLHKCSLAFGIELTDLLEGQSAKLSSYSVTRKGCGLVTAAEDGITIRNMAALFRQKLATPYWVTYQYSDELQNKPIHTTTHGGQEFDLVLKGSMRVRVGDHEETLHEGDSIFYKSSTPHGMIAVDGADCTFLAMIMASTEEEQAIIVRPRAVEEVEPEKLLLEKEGLANVVCRKLELACGAPELTGWEQMVARIKTASRHVTIALVGKYTELHDAYLSVEESLFHAGTANHVIVDIRWVDSSQLRPETVERMLDCCAGILVPGGFGDRGIEGMILAVQYARTHKIPYFGICLGMQIAVIEFARHVLGWEDAHSAEFDEFTKHPVIDIMPEQKTVTQKGGTMRLGAYPCVLSAGSRAAALYEKTEISERHRHRYEFCNDFRDDFVAAGLVPTGLSPDGRLVEIVELPEHPWFVACQFHPELQE